MKVEDYEVREGLYYSKDHEWIKIEDSFCRVGISDYAQRALHEVVFVELPDIGRGVSKSDSLGTLESVKAVAEVYSLISGEVTEVNKTLRETPELINNSPYDDGWMVVIKPLKLDEELKDLMDAAAYCKYIKELSSQ